MTTLTMDHVKIMIGDRLLCKLDGVWQLGARDKVAIIGANGAGKSTLLAVLAGRLEPEEGTVSRNCSIAELKQASGARGDRLDDRQANGSELFPLYEAGDTVKRWRALEHDAVEAHGSGGERTRRGIAELFASGAEVLIADEPTSHLDEEGIRQLEEALGAYSGAVLFVSHDRQLMDSICHFIMEIDDGVITVYKGNYTDYRKEKEAGRARAMFEYNQYANEKMRLERALVDVKGSVKSMKNKPSRMSYKEANLGVEGARSRQAKVERAAQAIETRIEKLEVKQKPREADIPLFDAAVHELCRSKHVLRIENLSYQLPKRSLFNGLNVAVKPGMRVAVTGPNGAGKTTLLRLIHEQAAGVVTSLSCRIGYFRQDLSLLDDSKSVLDNVLSTAIYSDTHVRTVLARTLFKGQNVFKRVRMLSGGERVKAALAKLFLGPYNLLLIDEPTNYLDIYAREQLEQALTEYPGTVLFASHDRRLLQAVATHTLKWNSEAQWQFSEGSGTVPLLSDKRAGIIDSDYEESRLKLERDLAETIALLSMPQRSDADKAALDKKFNHLLALRRELINLNK
ncbi:MAG: ribosomal protection-like ABC-F family protein [Candidatus Pristimantibacillus sp.]